MIENIERFFELARERYKIHLLRAAGVPRGQWTTDPVFQEYRFCNTHRELDRTTVWCRENVRERHPDSVAKTILNIVAFRWFNRIETGERLLREGLFDEWDARVAHGALLGVSPVVTGAYLIKTPSGMSKLQGVVWCIENFRTQHLDHVAACLDPGLGNWLLPNSLEDACELLMEVPYLGGFMAHQIVADLKYTSVLRDASDRLEWAFPGPGTARGLGRIFMNDPGFFNRNSDRDRAAMQELLKVLIAHARGTPGLWPEDWLAWEMSDISNWCCEYDKYMRVTVDGARMKQRFNPRAAAVE